MLYARGCMGNNVTERIDQACASVVNTTVPKKNYFSENSRSVRFSKPNMLRDRCGDLKETVADHARLALASSTMRYIY